MVLNGSSSVSKHHFELATIRPCPPDCPTRGQGMLGTAGPGPFVWVSSQPASPVASPPPPPHGQSYKAPQDLLSSPCFRQGTDAADGEMSQEDAEGAQPLLFQMNSKFLQLSAPSCMTMGEICFATHSPLYPPPWHTANPSLPPKPQLISRLHMATTCGSSAAGTSPGTA